MKCPECGKEFEPCGLCRGQYNHQQCVDDKICHDCTMSAKNKPGTWEIKRWIIEEYEVEATSREEALEKLEDPHTVTVIKETVGRKSG